MCELTAVSRAGFYRHWEEKAPTEAEMALRDAIQRQKPGVVGRELIFGAGVPETDNQLHDVLPLIRLRSNDS